MNFLFFLVYTERERQRQRQKRESEIERERMKGGERLRKGGKVKRVVKSYKYMQIIFIRIVTSIYNRLQMIFR